MDYIYNNGELFHYGVPGMKWGVRKKYYGSSTNGVVANKPKSQPNWKPKKTNKQKQWENDNGINPNRPNTINYTDKQRKRDRAFYGNRGEKRINKKLNEGHGLQGARHYEVERKARKEKAAKTARRGAVKATKILNKIGMAYLADQIFYDGTGTKIAKETIKTSGRAAVTAFVMARGGYDIRWYDK